MFRGLSHADASQSGDNPSSRSWRTRRTTTPGRCSPTSTYEITEQFELDAALRYDEDQRAEHDRHAHGVPARRRLRHGVHRRGAQATLRRLQPKVTLRYKPTDDLTLYGGYSRGFRSGGFNQTGVGAVAAASGIVGVNDVFQAGDGGHLGVGLQEPVPGPAAERRTCASSTRSRTTATSSCSDADTRTQNLGNLDADYKGVELELSAQVDRRLRRCIGSFGYTDSEITGMRGPHGDRQPGAAGLEEHVQPRRPVASAARRRARRVTLRADYQQIGPTWWEPYNVTSRDPGRSRRPARSGCEGETWAVTAWSKNLTDEEYNAEFSPGGFLFRALPRRYGVEFSYKF